MTRPLYLLVLTGVMFISCTTLKKIVDIKKPDASVDEVSVTSLSFESIGLLFNIGINNPNQLSIKLSGFDYNLFLNDQNFLTGQQNEEIFIKSSKAKSKNP